MVSVSVSVSRVLVSVSKFLVLVSRSIEIRQVFQQEMHAFLISKHKHKRIVRDYTSFAYAQQRSSAESSEPTEPPPAKKTATVTSASDLFGHTPKRSRQHDRLPAVLCFASISQMTRQPPLLTHDTLS